MALFSEKLKKARKHRGFTQKEVAKLADIAQSTYSDLERGNTLPERKTKISLARVLGDNFGEPNLNECLNGNEAAPSKKEIVKDMSAKEFVSLKFGGKNTRRSKKDIDMLTTLLDAEIERMKEEEEKYGE